MSASEDLAWSLPLRWGALLLLSLIFSVFLEWLGLPAAPLLGPLAAAVMLSMRGQKIKLPKPAFVYAQGVVGVMIASYLPHTIFQQILSDWPVFLGGTLSTLSAAAFLGWFLTRSKMLPGTTAIWGFSPGAATVMTLMSASYGADMRLVAFMQYLRVVCCAVIAACMARILGTPAVAQSAAHVISPATILTGLGLVLTGSTIGLWLSIPAGGLLLPMALGMIARLGFSIHLEQPFLLRVVAYAVVGWAIGMRFTPDILLHAARVLPRLLSTIIALIVICFGFAVVLAHIAHVDLLTAYLATSPGGADSVAIIASTTQVDMPFVIAMQIARFFCVLITGPTLARFLSRRTEDS